MCNGPKLTIVAGPEGAIAALHARLEQQEIPSRRLPTTHAFHSRMMEPACEAFARLVKTVELKAPGIACISNLSGGWITEEEATDAHYWTRHMCEDRALRRGRGGTAEGRRPGVCGDGAGQTLASLIKQHPRYRGEDGPVIVPTLAAVYQKQPEQELLLGSLGKLWLAGVQPDWTGFYGHERRQRVSLPTYPFERQRYWVEPGEGPVARKASPVVGKNPEMAEWFYQPSWRNATVADASRTGSDWWLLFVDESALSAGTAARLTDAGQRVITVRAGRQFAKRDEERYEIRPDGAHDYERLIQQLREAGRLPSRIGHLWCTAVATGAETATEDLARWQTLGYYSLIYTVQALAKQRVLEPLDVVMVSSNMQAVSGDEDLCPPKATLLGPCKGIPQESPHIRCRSVDLQRSAGDADADPTQVAHLVAELLRPPPIRWWPIATAPGWCRSSNRCAWTRSARARRGCVLEACTDHGRPRRGGADSGASSGRAGAGAAGAGGPLGTAAARPLARRAGPA